jgi:hypothetical protein
LYFTFGVVQGYDQKQVTKFVGFIGAKL